MLTKSNYQDSYLQFNDRQAGISLVYSDIEQSFFYNAYCIETKLLKELFSVEFDFLDDAIDMINSEFSSWSLQTFEKKSGCGNCAAK